MNGGASRHLHVEGPPGGLQLGGRGEELRHGPRDHPVLRWRAQHRVRLHAAQHTKACRTKVAASKVGDDKHASQAASAVPRAEDQRHDFLPDATGPIENCLAEKVLTPNHTTHRWCQPRTRQCTAHLAGAGCAIGKNAHAVAVQRRLHQLRYLLEHLHLQSTKGLARTYLLLDVVLIGRRQLKHSPNQ